MSQQRQWQVAGSAPEGHERGLAPVLITRGGRQAE